MNAHFRNPRQDSLRRRMEAPVERLIEAMDALDASAADIEQDTDLEETGDDEPDLAGTQGLGDDRELDDAESGIGDFDGMLEQGCRMPGQWAE